MQNPEVKNVAIVERVFEEDGKYFVHLQGREEPLHISIGKDTFENWQEKIATGEPVHLGLTPTQNLGTAESKIAASKIAARQRKRSSGLTIPAKGYVRHPLLRLPRNGPCPCDKTGKKFKKCCLPKLSLYIPANDAKIYTDYVKGKLNHGEIKTARAAR